MGLGSKLIGRLFAGQLRKPRGLVGRLTGRALARGNIESNDWTVSLLGIQPKDRVLEVGFGPGLAIKSAGELASEGWVAGIDHSETMVKQASKLNSRAIEGGRIELRRADVSSMPYNDEAFDKVFAVNIIYLWPDLESPVKELRRVMRPGGLLALYLAPLELVDKLGLRRSPLFTIHGVDDVFGALREADFTDVRVETKVLSDGTAKCVLTSK